MDRRETCRPHMPKATPIIPREMQANEAQRHTNNLQQNSKREKCQIGNVDSQVEFRGRN